MSINSLKYRTNIGHRPLWKYDFREQDKERGQIAIIRQFFHPLREFREVGYPPCRKYNYHSDKAKSLIAFNSNEKFSVDHSESSKIKELYKARSSLGNPSITL